MSVHHNSVKLGWERSRTLNLGMGALPRWWTYVEPVSYFVRTAYYDVRGPTPVEEEGWRG